MSFQEWTRAVERKYPDADFEGNKYKGEYYLGSKVVAEWEELANGKSVKATIK